MNDRSMNAASEAGSPPRPLARPARLRPSRHPLGPLVYRLPAGDPRTARMWAALALVVCSGLLGLAAFLQPDPRGLGTHTQLGLPQCGLVQTLGVPCPTCGMTTAFGHTVRGRWVAAFDAQPAGWLLCLATAAAAGLALSTLISAKTWRLNWYRATPARVALLTVGLLLGGWVYKIVRVVTDGSVAAAW